MPDRERGRVLWFKPHLGSGRIVSDAFGDTLFVHFSSIVVEQGFRALDEGQLVEYTRVAHPGHGGKQSVATHVIPIRKVN